MNRVIIAVIIAVFSTPVLAQYDDNNNGYFYNPPDTGYNWGQIYGNQQMEQNWLDQQYNNSIDPNCTGYNGC